MQEMFWREETMEWQDDFFLSAKSEDELFSTVERMEKNSIWIDDIETNGLYVSPSSIADINDPLQLENVRQGTGLQVSYQHRNIPISVIGRSSLLRTAKVNGSALSRLTRPTLASVINDCLAVQSGTTLMLLRYQKAMAFHSDSYKVIPISEVLASTKKQLEKRFGRIEFYEGHHSNAHTSIIWTLPNMQSTVMDKYYAAISDAISAIKMTNLMPAIRVTSSDTANNMVEVLPILISNEPMTIVDGIAVKHEKHKSSDVLDGLALYEERLPDVFAKFDDATQSIQRMAETEILNPVNCLIGVINKVNRSTTMIPKKYADAALQEVEALTAFSPGGLSMYDIFMSLSECIRAAKRQQASYKVLNNIDEAIARIAKMDWSDYDIGGTVAWSK